MKRIVSWVRNNEPAAVSGVVSAVGVIAAMAGFHMSAQARATFGTIAGAILAMVFGIPFTPLNGVRGAVTSNATLSQGAAFGAGAAAAGGTMGGAAGAAVGGAVGGAVGTAVGDVVESVGGAVGEVVSEVGKLGKEQK